MSAPLSDDEIQSMSCSDCAAPLASPEELESGLCLRCLNGLPHRPAAPVDAPEAGR